METADMNEQELRRTVRNEIDTYFNEKIYDSPVFKLSERIVRVEEEIKHNGERIDDLIHQMDKRFEQVDKKFAMQFTFTSIGFTLLAVLMTVYQFVD